MKLKVRLMLDSGVFSAWSRDETLDLKAYIKYLRQNEKYLFSYVNMDVIPGKFGTARTLDQVAHSASKGYKNLQRMKDAGLRPMPVFHQGEAFSWLEKMLQDGEDYIGISSAKDLWAAEQSRWLDQVFSILTDTKGLPYVRTHGFGLTNPKIILRFPWYSVDSTTWSMMPGYGQIMIPRYGNNGLGEPNYIDPPLRVAVSGIAHQSAVSSRRQLAGYAVFNREEENDGISYELCIKRFLEEEVGVSVAEARYGTGVRRRAMLVYYTNVMKHLKDVRFTHRTHDFGFARTSIEIPDGLKGIHIKHPMIMFATCLSKEWSMLMNETGASTRLLSYYELKQRPQEDLIAYVTKGIVGEYNKQSPKQIKWDSEAYRNFRRLALYERLNNDGPNETA